MFIAKIKTATVVLCSIAALGVGTGGVYYQTRAGAADSPQGDQVVQINRNRNNNSEPRDREIDKLRQENQQLRNMLERERNRREADRDKFNGFQNNIGKFMRAGLAARSDELDQVQSDGPDKSGSNRELEKREAERQFKKKYQDQFEALQHQLRELDMQQKKLEAERKQLESRLKDLVRQREQLARTQKKMEEGLQREAAGMKDKIKREQSIYQSKNKPLDIDKPASGDKLDQILQRLERLEKRLNRLERDRDRQ